MKSRILTLAICLALGCGVAGCAMPGENGSGAGTKSMTNGHGTGPQIRGELGEALSAFAETISWEEVSVRLPGMQGSKTLLYLSDLHLITESDQIAQDQLENVRGRMAWSSHDGVTAANAWPVWVDYLNAAEADGLLFGADMVDFASKSNVTSLGKGLERLETPWLYVRADHDLAPSYLSGIFESESIGYQRELGGYDDVVTMEFDEFFVAGWNNSTGQLTPAGLEKLKEIFGAGKPVILLTHVPIQPILESAGGGDPKAQLTNASKDAWGGRVLLWGNQGTECAYQPNGTTQEFLNMIYDEQSPVREILCGHLHFSWDGMVTETVHQHVFGAALERCAGIINISGKQ